MRVGEAVALLERVDTVRHAPSDLAEVRDALGKITRLRAWLDGCEADLAAATVGRTPSPLKDVADAGRTSQRHANRILERHNTGSDVTPFGKAMAEGDVSGAHLDVLAAGIRSLEPVERHGFRQHAAALVEHAKTSSVEEFRKLVQAEARRYSADHGEARLARQKRACRLRSWVDPADGMWKLAGTFDPETGLILHNRLTAAMSRLFHKSVPDNAPDDPGERADFLRAHALIDLTTAGTGTATGAGRAEIIPVIHVTPTTRMGRDPEPDTGPPPTSPTSMRPTRGSPAAAPPSRPHQSSRSTHPHGSHASSRSTPPLDAHEHSEPSPSPGPHESTGSTEWRRSSGPPRHDESSNPPDTDRQTEPGPHIEWGIPVELPWSVLRQLFENGAEPQTVVVCNGVVLHAPGEMNLGRTTRLASRAQRRALRALYPTCAAPGCGVNISHTQPHHIVWWDHGGPTDLDNLLPLCSRHHHLVHDGGWELRLDHQRRLTITYPDGTSETVAPPVRRREHPAAA